ncbi:MAG TPA: efflux transporter outer membrane subunit [Planctomycetota bacterium]
MKRLLPLLCLGALSCAVGPDYERPDIPQPAAWRDGTAEAASLADVEWWKLFGDPVLNGLIGNALAANFDVRLAVERVAEVRARLGFVRADLYPRLDAGAEAGVVRDSLEAAPLSPLIRDRDYQTYTLFGALSWELDLFGRIRRAVEAERAGLAAAEEDRHAAMVSVIAEVAQAYLDVRDLDARVEISKATVASRRSYVDLAKLRFEGGKTPEVDLRQAEAELGRVESILFDLERRLAEREHDLAFLLGRNPGPVPRGRPLAEIPIPPQIPPGLPAALLRRRPDIRGAEQRLVAANARIGEAEALLYPRIALTAQAGYSSIQLSEFLKSPAGFWEIIGGITAPIWDWGKNRARVQETEAVMRQAVILYERSIRQALRDVEDALVAYRKSVAILESNGRRTTAQRSVLNLSEARYRGGVSTYLEVLDAQRELFDAELQQAGALRDRIVSVVRLYRALGGGWEASPPE